MAGKTDRFCLAGRRCACFVRQTASGGRRSSAAGTWSRCFRRLRKRCRIRFFFCGGGRRAGLHAVACAAGPTGRRVFGRRCGLPALSDGDGGAVFARAVQGAGGPGPARGARLFARRAVRALALCETDFFGCAASVSGSLWYPGFAPYLQGRLPRPAQAVYLSLGDREPLGGPALMRTVGTATEAAAALLRQNGRRVY